MVLAAAFFAANSFGAPTANAACLAGSIADLASDGRCIHLNDIPDGQTKPPGEIDVEPDLSRIVQLLRINNLGTEQLGDVFKTVAVLGQTVSTAGVLVSALNQNLIAAALDGDLTPDGGDAVSPLMVSVSGAAASPFMISGYKHREHDGFSVVSSAPLSSGKTPGFEENHYGLTLGTRFDGSALFDAPARSVTLGVLANYTHTEIDVDAPAALPLSKGGSAEVDSWSAGAYGLVTDGRRYGLLTVTGTYGSPETDNAVLPATAEFNNFGLATSAMTGILLSAGQNAKVDLRGGLTYVNATSDDYSDSNGISFTDARMEEFSGSVSARLFGVVQTEGYTLRPFVQTGLTHRFHYENELNVDGESFSFDEADSSIFARAGLDFNVDASTQAYLAIRGDASEDYRSVEGQVGVTFKLD
ncbi:MAG: autotransporter outer membrane beta-barrel domain-containing protein [Rhodomicrobiaceae bacterium]